MVLLLLLSTPALAEQPGEVVEWMGSGGINWSSGKVFAEGIGVPPERIKYAAQKHALACRAAVIDAQRNLLEATQGVRITSKTLIKDFVVESDLIRATIAGVVKGAQMMDKQMSSDGSCRIMLGMSLSGDVAATLYQRAFGDPRRSSHNAIHADALRLAALIWHQFPTVVSVAHAEPVPVSTQWQDEINKVNRRLEALERLLKLHPDRIAQGVAEGDPTGLIIDARGSNFIPSLAPRVRRIRGGIIYPDAHNKKSAQESGRLISLFMNDLLLAQGHPRVGSRPLVIKALRTWGKTRTELVLGRESSDKLNTLIKKGFLENASVIVVLD